MSADRYTVKIVFRGLCMAHKGPDDGSLDIYLPDLAEVPQPTAEQAEADPRARVLRPQSHSASTMRSSSSCRRTGRIHRR